MRRMRRDLKMASEREGGREGVDVDGVGGRIQFQCETTSACIGNRAAPILHI